MLNDATRWLLPKGLTSAPLTLLATWADCAPLWHARLQLSIVMLQLPVQKVLRSSYFPGITLSQSCPDTKHCTVKEPFTFSYEGTWKAISRGLCMDGGVTWCRNSSYKICTYVPYHVFPYWYLLSCIYRVLLLVNYLLHRIHTHTRTPIVSCTVSLVYSTYLLVLYLNIPTLRSLTVHHHSYLLQPFISPSIYYNQPAH